MENGSAAVSLKAVTIFSKKEDILNKYSMGRVKGENGYQIYTGVKTYQLFLLHAINLLGKWKKIFLNPKCEFYSRHRIEEVYSPRTISVFFYYVWIS